MRGTVVVEIGSDSAVGCSRRILLACESRSLTTLQKELLHAKRVCRRTAVPGSRESSLAAEQTELLEGIVDGLRAYISGHIPSASAELFLLDHLART